LRESQIRTEKQIDLQLKVNEKETKLWEMLPHLTVLCVDAILNQTRPQSTTQHNGIVSIAKRISVELINHFIRTMKQEHNLV
jgi:hypothetical protein